MDRRRLIAGLAGAALPAGAHAYQRQVATPAGPVMEVGVSPAAWTRIYATQTLPNWCWAASLQMLFAAAGHRVDQRRIVQTAYGSLVDLPVFTAADIAALSNRPWIDDQGQPFASRLVAAYDANAGINRIDNAIIVEALANERPMIVCNRSHAMLLTGAQYIPTPSGPNIVDMGVFDPWPGRGARGPDRPREFLAAQLGGELMYIGLAIIG